MPTPNKDLSILRCLYLCVLLITASVGSANNSNEPLGPSEDEAEIIEINRCDPLLSIGQSVLLNPPSLATREKARQEAVEGILNSLKGPTPYWIREERARSPLMILTIEPTHTALLDALYENGVLKNSPSTIAMSYDKLMTYEVLRSLLGEKLADRFLARTFGLIEFSRKHNFIDDDFNLLIGEKEFVTKMWELFPNGLVLKQAESAQGRELGTVLFNQAAILQMYKTIAGTKGLRAIISGKTLLTDGHTVQITSEEFLLQELLPGFQDSTKQMSEFRVHTLEDRVVPGATYQRWSKSLFPTKVQNVEAQINEFLGLLPRSALAGVALGLDVLVGPDGTVKIVEINSPRSRLGWSGYLVNPFTLGAYVRLLEKDYNIHFAGWNGLLFRTNTANLKNGFDRAREKQP